MELEEKSYIKSINSFGRDNLLMSDEVPHRHIDTRVANIHNYLDMRLITKWVFSKFSASQLAEIKVLDVGAGTGRLTRRLSKIVGKCVSIEPFPIFFERLKASSNNSNVELYQYTIQEYVKITNYRFDFILLSGVLMYHNDNEIVDTLDSLHKILNQNGLILIKDLGIENRGWGGPPYGTLSYDGHAEIFRPPKGMKIIFDKTKYKCLKWRRTYPINVAYKLYRAWPNLFTDSLLGFMSKEFFYPLWGKYADLNLHHISENCYFAYLLKEDK